MKKIISIVLGLTLVLCLFSALALSSSAANSQILRTYEKANDGDILFLANFKDPAYTANAQGKISGSYVSSEDGKSLTIKGVSGQDQKLNFYGAAFEELVVPADAKVTFVCQVKANGTIGKNNSIGIGGWFVDQYEDPAKWSFYNEYGNWNSVFPEGDNSANRAALSHNNVKQQDYTNGVDAATTDADGYMSMKIEFDGGAKKMTSYYVKDGAWVKNNTYNMNKTNKADAPDYLGVGIYNFYEVVDTTIKNVKFFKGVDLTVAQTDIVENVTPEVTTPEITTPDPTTPDHDCTTTPAPSATPTPTTTPAPTTAAPTTAAPTAAATTAAEEKGCGGTVAIAAIAIVPMFAAAVVIGKKKDK